MPIRATITAVGHYVPDKILSNFDLEKLTPEFYANPYPTYRALRENKGYLFTQFESDDAREAFPCWDEPGFKFPWQLTLEVPVAQEALTNTPVESVSEKDGWSEVKLSIDPSTVLPVVQKAGVPGVVIAGAEEQAIEAAAPLVALVEAAAGALAIRSYCP